MLGGMSKRSDSAARWRVIVRPGFDRQTLLDLVVTLEASV